MCPERERGGGEKGRDTQQKTGKTHDCLNGFDMFAKRLSKAATSVSAAGDVAGAGVRRHKASQTERDTVRKRGKQRGGGRPGKELFLCLGILYVCLSACPF